MAILSLKALEDHEIQAAGNQSMHKTRLSDACRHLLSNQGKKLRSSILLEAATCGTESNSDLVRQAAIAVELLHVSSLVHDDLVDEGKLRRGQETVGFKYGNSAAALVGGSLIARAVDLISECGDEAVDLFSNCITRICDGEMYQFQDLHDLDRLPEGYYRVIEAKTASLFELSGQLGASLAGAENSAITKLTRYGHELGFAFQISDDLLDLLVGDEVTGKTSGSDLRQGVYTLPVLYSLSKSKRLRDLLANDDADMQSREIIDEIRNAGGIDRAISDCRNHMNTAKEMVAGLPCDSQLSKVADHFLSRLTDQASS